MTEVNTEVTSASSRMIQLDHTDDDQSNTNDQRIDGAVPSPLEDVTSTFTLSSSRRRKRARLVPVVIIDRSALFRAGLVHILAGSRFRVTASGSSLEDLSESVFSDKRCVVLITTGKQAEAVLPRVMRLRKQGLRVVMLSERFCAEEVLAAIEVGADGYLLKNEIGPDALVKSLELVWLGGVVIPQEFAKLLKDRAQLDPLPNPETISADGQPRSGSQTAPTDDIGRLSNRERTILRQLTQGASNKHIARELNVAESTVKVHIKNLLRKIRVNNRTQAAMWAMENWRKSPPP